MKLWTIQERAFVEANMAEPLIANWDRAPQSWCHLYTWMAQQWNARVGVGTMSAPLWCWHSCDGVYGSCPTAGTFALLMGDWNYYAPKMTVLELDLPDQVPLLSSYSRWNEAIDDALDRRCDAIDGERFADMFDAPLFKHDSDSIQAVIPRIERSWVTGQWTLPAGDFSDIDRDMPCVEFPKIY